MRTTMLCLAALVLFFVNACNQSNLPEYKAYANDKEVPRISVEEAKKDYDAGIVLIVDSRPEATWQLERIASSISIPGTLSDEQVSKLPKDKKIIVYCS